MKNNSPSQRRYRAKRAAEYLRRSSLVEVDFYKRRIGELCEKFPDVFNKRMPLPLAIGISAQLEKETSFSLKEISSLLRCWVRRWEYSCMAASVGKRYNLDGSVSEPISEPQLKHYISVAVKVREPRLRIFCKRYLKETGRPALIFIPINQRPELEIKHD